MGIRGLAHQLRPYCVAIDFALANESLPDRDSGSQQSAADADAQTSLMKKNKMKRNCVVVDGPALAYHAYYAALSHRSHARTALEAMPAYGEVNDAAIEMLDTLQRHGLEISAIFFDGALPEIKRDVRMHRLEQCLLQMQKYRAVHAGSSNNSGDARMNYQSIADTKGNRNAFNSMLQIPAKLKTLPASSFLVASVIEALQTSRYGHLAAVVPGEADCFCAAYTRMHGGMILTSDSDLLAYDLGPSGSVAFLKDIEMHATGEGSRLRIGKYETIAIAAQLDLQSLLSFAFAVDEDPNRTAKQYLTRAQELQDGASLPYREFAAQYSTDLLVASCFTPHALSASAFGRLDPRIAEWMYETLDVSGTKIPNGLQSIMSKGIKPKTSLMYLPVLIEDTNRASAWDASVGLRKLAYALLQPSSIELQSSTIEVMRRGDRIAQVTVEHLSKDEVEPALRSLKQLAGQCSASSFQWHSLMMHMLLRYLVHEEKPLPSKVMIKALLARRRLLDWDYVHWIAQVHGIAYSLRMIHQCLKTLSSTPQARVIWTAAHIDCLRLLDTMPSIAAMCDEDEALANSVLDEEIGKIYSSLGIDESAYRPATSSKASKKRKKKRQRQKDGKEDYKPALGSSNIFTLLVNAS